MGVNTDAYQPVERRLGITRQLLAVLADHGHPVSIVTKSALIERDLDLLGQLADRQLVHVMVSLTTLDPALTRVMEPRAAVPRRRLDIIRNLTRAGVPTGVLMAPMIPFLNDQEITPLLRAAHEAGALEAGYVLLRLPLEVEPLFREWLTVHLPEKAQRIMNRLKDCRGGRTYDSRFGSRMRGEGVFADLIAQRFKQAKMKAGFPGLPELDCSSYRTPAVDAAQLDLFP